MRTPAYLLVLLLSSLSAVSAQEVDDRVIIFDVTAPLRYNLDALPFPTRDTKVVASMLEDGLHTVVTIGNLSVLMDGRSGTVLDKAFLGHEAAKGLFVDQLRQPMLLPKINPVFDTGRLPGGQGPEGADANDGLARLVDLLNAKAPEEVRKQTETSDRLIQDTIASALPPHKIDTPWGTIPVPSLAEAEELDIGQCEVRGASAVREAQLKDSFLAADMTDPATASSMDAAIAGFLRSEGVPHEQIPSSVTTFKEAAHRDRERLDAEATAFVNSVFADCIQEAKADPSSGRVCPSFIEKAALKLLAPPPLKPLVEKLYSEEGERLAREAMAKALGE